jgi:hypothetical protein
MHNFIRDDVCQHIILIRRKFFCTAHEGGLEEKY